jgi:hypothetical protein
MQIHDRRAASLLLALTFTAVQGTLAQGVGEWEADQETMRDYAARITEAKTKLTVSYLSAVANFETTVQQASPEEAKADKLGAALKSAWGKAKGVATGAVSKATGVEIAPLVEMYEAVDAEIDRAAAASTSLAAGEWIKSLRSKITNEYGKTNTEAYLSDLKAYYAKLTPDERTDWITGMQVELEGLKQFKNPETEFVERSLYESWINANFSHCSLGSGTGFVKIDFDSDGELEQAIVNAPLGAKIEGGIDRTFSGPLTDLEVSKQVCSYGDLVAGGSGWRCVCFDEDNDVSMSSDLVEASALLEKAKQVRSFKHS